MDHSDTFDFYNPVLICLEVSLMRHLCMATDLEQLFIFKQENLFKLVCCQITQWGTTQIFLDKKFKFITYRLAQITLIFFSYCLRHFQHIVLSHPSLVYTISEWFILLNDLHVTHLGMGYSIKLQFTSIKYVEQQQFFCPVVIVAYSVVCSGTVIVVTISGKSFGVFLVYFNGSCIIKLRF